MSLFAIVPAAGLSRRMGQPKLVMDIAGKTVIERLLTTLSHPEITETVVVIRRGDQQLADAIAQLAIPKVHVVQPEVDPPDMRTSVEHAIEYVGKSHSPQPADGRPGSGRVDRRLADDFRGHPDPSARREKRASGVLSLGAHAIFVRDSGWQRFELAPHGSRRSNPKAAGRLEVDPAGPGHS
jgi:hypothetical protein